MKRSIKIKVPEFDTTVSAVSLTSSDIKFYMVLAHGAGAGMNHKFMAELSEALLKEGIGTLRFNFMYMEEGSRRPDSRPKVFAVLRSAMRKGNEMARRRGVPLLLGGKSFGGRMFSLLAATEKHTPGIGLVFFGFPLHAPGKASTDRAAHLSEIPMPSTLSARNARHAG